MKVYLVLVGKVVYAVADTGIEEYPIAVVAVSPKKKIHKPVVITMHNFLKMAASHPIFGQVGDWSPFWQPLNDT